MHLAEMYVVINVVYVRGDFVKEMAETNPYLFTSVGNFLAIHC